MTLRETILRKAFLAFPFDIQGDCREFAAQNRRIRISCIINFYGRLDLLAGILYCLAAQDYPRESFEVILVEDRGGTEEGKAFCESFADRLPIVYAPLDKNHGRMGYSRNFGLARARGEYILFLDDDTLLPQSDFLARLAAIFAEHPGAAAVVPRGSASYALLEDHYDFHEPYFMTSRCTAYRREALQELGGFVNHFVGQEDVEFVTRFIIARKQAINAEALHYLHPPLLVPNTRKPRAVGFSFFGLRARYSWPLWILLLANCSRHAPLLLLPSRRFREQGRFGLGFLLGILDGIRGAGEQVYG